MKSDFLYSVVFQPYNEKISKQLSRSVFATAKTLHIKKGSISNVGVRS